MRDKFFTCSQCGEIHYESNIQYLDSRAICYSCLDKLRFDKYREECAQRGFHITKGVHGEFVGRQPREDGKPWQFRHSATCACNQSADFISNVLPTPILDRDGNLTFAFGMLMRGYSMPSAPKKWFVLEGKVTIIPEEDGQPCAT